MCRPCATCGTVPTVRRLRAVWLVACECRGCGKAPCAVGTTRERAEQDWDDYNRPRGAGERGGTK